MSTESAEISSPIAEEMFTAQELAKKWRVSADTIWRLCRNNELSHIKISRKVFIPAAAARAYLRKNTTRA